MVHMETRWSLFSLTKESAQPVIAAKMKYHFLGPGEADPMSNFKSSGEGYVVLHSVPLCFCAKEEKMKAEK